MKKAILLLITFIIILSLLTSCNSETILVVQEADKQYIMFMFTNKHHLEVEDYLPEMKQLYGEIDPESDRMYAFGLIGPMLLTQSIKEMADQIENAFDMAERYNIPVYFQLDDMNNNTTHYGSGAEMKFYENPLMCEWIAFPQEGEKFGGEKKYGRPPGFWTNWGVWASSPATPNFESPEFRELISNNLEKGVIEPLQRRYEKLVESGKEYLFAGLAIGWETHIPDYSRNNDFLRMNPDNPPRHVITGEIMEGWEFAQYGYAALHSRGYDEEKLKLEAESKGISVHLLKNEILYDVIHKYSEFLAKKVYEAGIPRHKIFTHVVGASSVRGSYTTFLPPIWTAVNDYSTPGFTMSQTTCPYNLKVIKQEIEKADTSIKHFGLVEGYAAGLHEEEDASAYLNEKFHNGALIVAVFSYADMGTRLFQFSRTPDFGFNIAVNRWLEGD